MSKYLHMHYVQVHCNLEKSEDPLKSVWHEQGYIVSVLGGPRNSSRQNG